MKILAICGSPRKGNTYSALNTIKENFPDIDFEILMLKDLHFELCKGCYACILRGEDKCPIRDDRASVHTAGFVACDSGQVPDGSGAARTIALTGPSATLDTTVITAPRSPAPPGMTVARPCSALHTSVGRRSIVSLSVVPLAPAPPAIGLG